MRSTPQVQVGVLETPRVGGHEEKEFQHREGSGRVCGTEAARAGMG